jgi:hypothetical protein
VLVNSDEAGVNTVVVEAGMEPIRRVSGLPEDPMKVLVKAD